MYNDCESATGGPNDDDVFQLSCSQCGKRFWIPSELKYHVDRVHEGKKDFSCPDCPKRFADKKNLKKHAANVHRRRRLSNTE